MGITQYGDVTGPQAHHLGSVYNAIINFFDNEGYFQGAEVKTLTKEQLLQAIKEDYEGILSCTETLVTFNPENKKRIDQLVKKGKLIKIESKGFWSVALENFFRATFRNILPL